MNARLDIIGPVWFCKQYPKTYWTEDDLKQVYEIYSEITGTPKKDVHCRSCRRNTINFLKKYYLAHKDDWNGKDI